MEQLPPGTIVFSLEKEKKNSTFHGITKIQLNIILLSLPELYAHTLIIIALFPTRRNKECLMDDKTSDCHVSLTIAKETVELFSLGFLNREKYGRIFSTKRINLKK